MPSHYLNQCCDIVNWTLRNKLQWNFNQNTKLFIHANASENIICEMVAILSRGDELRCCLDVGIWNGPRDPAKHHRASRVGTACDIGVIISCLLGRVDGSWQACQGLGVCYIFIRALWIVLDIWMINAQSARGFCDVSAAILNDSIWIRMVKESFKARETWNQACLTSLQNKIWNLPDRSTILPKFIYGKEGKLAGPAPVLLARICSQALILKTVWLFN